MENQNTSPTSSRESITQTCFPQRYFVTLMILFMTINCYTNRNLVGNTLKYFAEIKPKINRTKDRNQCVDLHQEVQTHTEQNFTKIFEIDSDTSEDILNLFYISYTITHFPAGIYADTRSPKHLLSLVTIAMSVINLSSPTLIKATKGNHNVMRVVTILLGLLQGALYPASTSMLAHWVPSRERASLLSLTLAGYFLALIVQKSGTNFFVKSCGNWTMPFYVFGSFGLIWTVVWECLVFPDPHKDPRITEGERNYLDQEMRDTVDHKPKKIPYIAMFTSLQVWMLILIHAANRWSWYFSGYMIPAYTKDVLKYGSDQTILLSTLPYIPMTVLIISLGYFSDWITRNGYVYVLTMRKLLSSIGMMGPPIYMLTGSYAGCNRIGAH
ncbi:sialin-like isoform X3 [Tribolium castaneum]|uniref:sialin-like isoform X3 n=1 Tax=Tribolium castaneum TaxID=7070 RepID=UPI00077DDAEC|nr:PREDICTED: sialin-like isoform X4 [Tribolium castaneum]|eukprot:XP_015838125.1 PREDICTED: sialin-like isoform X4 [Tribolium castaneum]